MIGKTVLHYRVLEKVAAAWGSKHSRNERGFAVSIPSRSDSGHTGARSVPTRRRSALPPVAKEGERLIPVWEDLSRRPIRAQKSTKNGSASRRPRPGTSSGTHVDPRGQHAGPSGGSTPSLWRTGS